MKILNVCQDDWANFSYDNMMALRAVGLHCDAIKRNKHISEYENEAEIVASIEAVKRRIAEYDVIQFFHDNVTLFSLLHPAMKGKKIIAYHTSSMYRRDYYGINGLMNPNVYKCVCAMPEFMDNGAKEAVYMVGAVNTEQLQPTVYPGNPYIFAHYPSNPVVKGTETVLQLFVDALGNLSLSYSDDHVPAKEQIQRMRSCDIYLEMFSMFDSNGMPYGNFGITALEAAALGKVVVTNCVHWRVYQGAYGKLGLQVCNKENDFISAITRLDNMPLEELAELQNTTREWVVKNHSYKATGEYFLKHVLN